MSDTGHQQPHLTPVEQHLGDRLAAFVDGELHDDARDRVASHLATCPGCKDAADEQRRLKNAVAAAAPPALSAGLLARLQGLPGGDEEGHDPFRDGPGSGDIFGTASLGGERLDGGLFGGSGRQRSEQFSFNFSLPFTSRGFRIHEMPRPEPLASSPPSSATPSTTVTSTASPPGRRGRKLAFAAAGAFSMAAIALGGALPMNDAVVDVGNEEPNPTASPMTVSAHATASLTDLWRGVGGVDLTAAQAPGVGQLRPPTAAMTTFPALGFPSLPPESVDIAATSGGESPAPVATWEAGPVVAAAAPSPSTLDAPAAPFTPATPATTRVAMPADTAHPMPQGGSGATP